MNKRNREKVHLRKHRMKKGQNFIQTHQIESKELPSLQYRVFFYLTIKLICSTIENMKLLQYLSFSLPPELDDGFQYFKKEKEFVLMVYFTRDAIVYNDIIDNNFDPYLIRFINKNIVHCNHTT